METLVSSSNQFYDLSHRERCKLLLYNLHVNSELDLRRESSCLNLLAVINLGQINVSAFAQAFGQMVAGHDNLRAHFIKVGSSFKKVILPTDKVPSLNVVHLEASNVLIQEHLRKDEDWEFELIDSPLWMANLYVKENSEAIFSFSVNHIITDQWSMNVLNHDLWSLYEAILSGADVSVESGLPGAQIGNWEKEQLAIHGESLKDYWKRELSGTLPTFYLQQFYDPAYHHPLIQSYKEELAYECDSNGLSLNVRDFNSLVGNIHRITCYEGPVYRTVYEQSILDSLNEVAAKLGTTFSNLLIVGYKLTLFDLTHKPDIVVGGVWDLRDSEFMNTVGWLAYNFLLRSVIDEEMILSDFIENVEHKTFEVLDHKLFRLDRILELCDVSLEALGTTFINIFHETEEQTITDFSSAYEEENSPCFYDIDCMITRCTNGIEVKFRYKQGLFDRSFIEMLSKRYRRILNKMMDYHYMPINEILTRG
ncbi:MAG: condensation domain-containing protein [Cytophagales bacterium]|nr:condensation domain-containing protein [Cytophagales bacterium]